MLVSFGNMFAQRLGQVRDAALELLHGALEFALVGLIMRKEPVQQFRDVRRLAEGEFASFAAILIQNRYAGILKDRVARRVSGP